MTPRKVSTSISSALRKRLREADSESPSPRTRKTSRQAAPTSSIDISELIDADDITEAYTEQLSELNEVSEELQEIRAQTSQLRACRMNSRISLFGFVFA